MFGKKIDVSIPETDCVWTDKNFYWMELGTWQLGNFLKYGWCTIYVKIQQKIGTKTANITMWKIIHPSEEGLGGKK